MGNTSYLVLASLYFLRVCQAISLFEMVDQGQVFTPTNPEIFVNRSNDLYTPHKINYNLMVEDNDLAEAPQSPGLKKYLNDFNDNENELKNKLLSEISLPPFHLMDDPITSNEELLLVSPIRPKNTAVGEPSKGPDSYPEETTSTSKELLPLDSFPTKDDIYFMNLLNSSKIKEYKTASGVLLRFVDFPDDSDDETSIDSGETDSDVLEEY